MRRSVFRLICFILRFDLPPVLLRILFPDFPDLFSDIGVAKNEERKQWNTSCHCQDEANIAVVSRGILIE